jgi:hypothetical protein
MVDGPVPGNTFNFIGYYEVLHRQHVKRIFVPFLSQFPVPEVLIMVCCEYVHKGGMKQVYYLKQLQR